ARQLPRPSIDHHQAPPLRLALQSLTRPAPPRLSFSGPPPTPPAMTSFRPALVPCGLLTPSLAAQNPTSGPNTGPSDDQWLDLQIEELTGADMSAIDPTEIINESYNFRKEREPDMTAAEFALYERMSGMVDTNPEFALQLLETMLNDD